MWLSVLLLALLIGQKPPNPNEFPLTVKVVGYSEHTEDGGPVTTNCVDTSIPGPYPKSTSCTTTGGNINYRYTQMEIGNTKYKASCDCDVVPLGEYQGRWKDENHVEILSPDSKGKLKPHRYRMLSATLISSPNPKSNPIEKVPELFFRFGTAEGLASECRKGEGLDTATMKMPPQDMADFAMCLGFVNGIIDIDTLRGAPHLCIPNTVSGTQLAKVFVKYANEHPEQIHYPAAGVAYVAFKAAFPCN